MRRRIIIDTDPGIDDAVAILLALAAAELDVAALVTVAGNLALAPIVRNALALVELAGRPEIPVYAGCPRPMAPVQIDAGHVHGEAGLGALSLPEPGGGAQPVHGVTYLVETLRRAPAGSMTLCALGPLTNVAAALVMAPEAAAAIEELVIMGGGSHGNITPVAEFNIHADPQAAAIVFASGVPITVVPLDVTGQTRSTPERVEAIRTAGGHCCTAVAELIGPRGGPGRPPIPMHDPCVIAWLLAPELFRASEVNIAIETESPLTLGMTVIDRRGRSGRPVNARLLDAIDVDGFYRLLAKRLALLP